MATEIAFCLKTVNITTVQLTFTVLWSKFVLPGHDHSLKPTHPSLHEILCILGPAYNDFGQKEHLFTMSRLLFTQTIDNNHAKVDKFGYKEHLQ